MTEKYIQTLKDNAIANPAETAGGESILGMLYECHNENHPYDNDQIKTDFREL